MPLQIRPARPEEYPQLEEMVIASFEPITWAKKLETRIGTLNGVDWRTRWQARMASVFRTQIILVGEAEGAVVAFASGLIDDLAGMGLVDILAVAPGHQGRGYGREMLRGILAHFKQQGCLYANLECLTDNDTGNRLYESEGFFEVARHIRWFKPL